MQHPLLLLKKLALLFSALFFLWIVMIMLMPKKSLWYETESFLKNKDIIFHDENLRENFLGLEIKEAQLYVGAIHAARIASIDMTTLGFYNSLSVEDFFIAKELQLLKGFYIKKLSAYYVPFSDVIIEAEGNFGTLTGFIDLGKRRIELEIQPKPWLVQQSLIVAQLKKTTKGYHFVRNY